MTTTAPVIIPAKAPMALKRFQYSDSRMVGPKEAPKPAQAKATRSRIVLLGFQAMTAATRAMAKTAMRE